MTTPFVFWTRIDSLLGKRSLVWLAKETGLNYGSMKNRRTLDRFPSVEDSYIIAKTLGTTVEYLLTGESEQLACPEAKAVQEDGTLQALVRAVMRDPRLIQIMGTLIESTERNIRDA